MRVNTTKVFQNPNFDFSWPTQIPSAESGLPTIPPEEQIVIKCRRLTYEAKRGIEDSMITVSSTGMSKAAAKSVQDMRLSYSIGTVKSDKIQKSVCDWINVLDEAGDPIRFTYGKFRDFLLRNCGLELEEYGSLEIELLAAIDRENSFTDSTSITGGDPKN